MEQHHVGVLGMDLVETIPDQMMVVEIEPAGQSDLGSGRQHDLDLGATFGGEKISGINDRRGERAMVDKRSRSGAPG
jgi:hypothetical protein